MVHACRGEPLCPPQTDTGNESGAGTEARPYTVSLINPSAFVVLHTGGGLRMLRSKRQTLLEHERCSRVSWLSLSVNCWN